MNISRYVVTGWCILAFAGLHAMEEGASSPVDVSQELEGSGIGDTLFMIDKAEKQVEKGDVPLEEAETSGNKLADKRGKKQEEASEHMALLRKRKQWIKCIENQLTDARMSLQFFEDEKIITTKAAQKLNQDLAQLKEDPLFSGGESAINESLLIAADEDTLSERLAKEEEEVAEVVRGTLVERQQKLKVYEAGIEENRAALEKQVRALRELLAKKAGEAKEAEDALGQTLESLKDIEAVLRQLGQTYQGAVAKEVMEDLSSEEIEVEQEEEGEEQHVSKWCTIL